MLSPSNLYAWSFLWSKCCSSAVAMVDCFFPRVLALIWELGDKTCLAGSAQTGEPDGAALLAEKGISLVLGDSSYVRG